VQEHSRANKAKRASHFTRSIESDTIPDVNADRGKLDPPSLFTTAQQAKSQLQKTKECLMTKSETDDQFGIWALSLICHPSFVIVT